MTLKSLRLIEANTRPKKSVEQSRRQRLLNQIGRQLQLVEAASRNERVKGEWWWRTDEGRLVIAARYGKHHLELAKGKHAVVCENLTEVYTALDMIKIAVENGEFDGQLEAVSGRIRANFNRTDRL